MIRIFFRLWIFVIVPLALMWAYEGLNPIGQLREGMLRESSVDQYKGAFELLFAELRELPENQWVNRVDDLSGHFGRRLSLRRLDDPDVDASMRETLPGGEYYFREGLPSVLARRIDGSDYFIDLALGEALDEGLERNARGTLHLIERRLEAVPAEDRLAHFAGLTAGFGVPVELLRWQDLSLSADDEDTLRNSGFLSSAEGDSLYGTVLDGQMVVHTGLATQAGGVLLLVAFAILAVSLGVGVVVWLFPFWRDVLHVNRVAADFGAGVLTVRASLPNKSAIRDLGRAFNDMADNVQRMIDGQRELTNSVSHDLRTPLSRLRFALEMLKTEPDPQARARYMANIDRSVHSLEAMIHQLLIHARFDRTPSAENFQPCDLDALLQEEVDLAVMDTDDLAISYAANAELEGKRFLIDKTAMSRAIANLLENASKYAKAQVLVSFETAERFCEIVVEDDGPGVGIDDRERVFQPFTRLEMSQQTDPSGHGLGLAIVKQVARWHGGEVYVDESPRLGGARFVLSIELCSVSP